jgi:hypothetical protein
MYKADVDRRNLQFTKPAFAGGFIRRFAPSCSSDSPPSPANCPCLGSTDAAKTISTAFSPESGVSDAFLEFEGTTTFAPTPSPTYRYSMTLKSGKLRIWLEDCESKKQWLASGTTQ